MTAFTDRADAVEAAIRDLARDIESDLGKLTRYRGSQPTTDGPWFRDPGPDVATYEQQKAAMPGRVQHTIDRYKGALSQARDAIPNDAANGPERARRAELVDLITAIASINTHDDAVALVESFEE